MKRKAGLSRCKNYRYWLYRRWRDGPELVVIGLNPSTADAQTDDPTLRRIMRFTHEWGFSAVTVVNLFAWRSRFPKELRAATDPVGPRNDYWIRRLTRGASRLWRRGVTVAACYRETNRCYPVFQKFTAWAQRGLGIQDTHCTRPLLAN